jgi:hypothetical protein
MKVFSHLIVLAPLMPIVAAETANMSLLTVNLDAKIVGVFSKGVTSANDRKLGDFKDVRVNGQQLAVPLPLGAKVESQGVVLMTMKRTTATRNEDVTMLLGVLPGDTQAVGQFDPATGAFKLVLGWVFIWGKAPMAATEWGAAAAEGTTIVVQTGAKHRYYFLKQTGTYPVNVKTEDVELKLKKADVYAEVDSDGVVTGPHKIVAGTDAAVFVSKVKEIAANAGWEP